VRREKANFPQKSFERRNRTKTRRDDALCRVFFLFLLLLLLEEDKRRREREE